MKRREIPDAAYPGSGRLPVPVVRFAARLHWRILACRPKRSGLRFLLILSHQRSGSSLLVHCLNTNPEIIGYGETLIHYASRADLERLPYYVMMKTRKFVGQQRYVVDKLLYDELLENEELLDDGRIYAIFLVREPRGALASLIRAPKLVGWPQRPEANRNFVDETLVAKYYTDRLRDLERYATRMNDQSRALFLTYQDIVEKTANCFSALQQFLSVRGSFSEEYDLLKTTGKPGFGDVSPNIRTGKIMRAVSRPEISIAPAIERAASDAFERCRSVMNSSCSTVTDSR